MTSLQDKTILVIDDSPSILTFLQISLELHGARFIAAQTATEGLELCAASAPDLVVLDLGLPDRDGIDILPELLQVPRKAPLPVVVLTVRKEATMRQRALESGARAYLTKPFMMEDLLDVLEMELDKVAALSSRDQRQA